MKAFILIPFALCVVSCNSHYRTPSLSSNPAQMSSQTLCYRYLAGKKTDAMRDEIAARHLDCDDEIADDPLYKGREF